MEASRNTYSIEDTLLLKGKLSLISKEKLRLSYEVAEHSLLKQKPTISKNSTHIARMRKDKWSIHCSHEFKCLEKNLANSQENRTPLGAGSALYQAYNSSVNLKQAKIYKSIIDRRKNTTSFNN